MVQKILHFLEHRSKSGIIAISAACMILLGVLDLLASAEIHFLLFYLVPIALVSWFVSRGAGVVIAVLCSLTWLLAALLNGRPHSAPWVALWNFLMRTGAFVTFALTQAQLRSKFDALSTMAGRDFLTGLPNGRAFYELTTREMNRAFGLEPLTLAFVDIAGFKWLNHRFGYATGDQMICTIAHTIRQCVPRPDLVGRTGGTSFAVLLPNTEFDGARFILQRIQHALKEERLKHGHPLTFFISAIACKKAPRHVAELMHKAESQMTRMKGGKRDLLQVAHVESLPALH